MQEIIFSATSALALLGWLGLGAGFAWRQGWALRVAGRLIPGLLAIAYAAVLAVALSGDGGGGGGFGSLAAVRQLFADPSVMLAGWIHYLCFDLLTGHWITTETRRRGLPGWLLVPALPLTFLFGPLGLLVFFAASARLPRRPATA